MILQKKNKICIVGAGGFAKEVFCCIEDILALEGKKAKDFCCFMVKDEDYIEDMIFGAPIIPESSFDNEIYEVVIAISDPGLRKKIVRKLPKETVYPNIIHPTATLSRYSSFNVGAVIMAGVVITCDIIIGKHVHLNLKTTIGHDCVIGDYFTTAPSVNVSGNCVIGDEVYIGTSAALRESIHVTNNVTIGMGAIIVKDIKESGVYIGNPAKRLK